MTNQTVLAPAHSITVFRGADVQVISGAQEGDTLSSAADLELDDTYALTDRAQARRMSVQAQDGTTFIIAPDTETGTPGASLHLDCALTLMTIDGQVHDALVLVEVDAAGDIEATYLLPLSQMFPKTSYTLLSIDTETAQQKLAQVSCVSFSRGTRITLASGELAPIEDLRVGTAVLSRDDGPQDIRWIGQSTVRAVGAFAPILIKAGTLNNDGDLLVSPDHRFFIYQRQDTLGAGRSELLIKARHLVNGDTVRVMAGGFVDYFQLAFDTHQIIYAEGIAVESLLIDPRTSPALPAGLAEKLGTSSPPRHSGFDVQESLLNQPNTAELLKRASTR